MDENRSRRLHLRVLAIGVAGLAAVSIAGGAMSMALFTDQQTVNESFTSGTIKLNAADIAGLNLTVGNFMPGSAVTDDVVVQNDGTAQLRYAVSATNADTSSPNGGPLSDVLVLTVKTVDVTTPLTPCNDFDGTQLFTGAMGATTAVFGTAAPGGGNGERTLDAATNETLCFRVALPLATGNAYQGAVDTTTFTFDAEQTANN